LPTRSSSTPFYIDIEADCLDLARERRDKADIAETDDDDAGG
jgi:hypothetical protein